MASMSNYPILKKIRDMSGNVKAETSTNINDLMNTIDNVNSSIDSVNVETVKTAQHGVVGAGTKTVKQASGRLIHTSSAEARYFDITIAPVDVDKSIPFITSRMYVGIVCELVNSTTLRCYFTYGNEATMTINGFSWEVIEFN